MFDWFVWVNLFLLFGMIVMLIGYCGSGKISVVVLFAQCLGFEFVDVDVDIEYCVGCSIEVIFVVDGEWEFRWIECEVLYELL